MMAAWRSMRSARTSSRRAPGFGRGLRRRMINRTMNT
jgi:hypothetical protein